MSTAWQALVDALPHLELINVDVHAWNGGERHEVRFTVHDEKRLLGASVAFDDERGLSFPGGHCARRVAVTGQGKLVYMIQVEETKSGDSELRFLHTLGFPGHWWGLARKALCRAKLRTLKDQLACLQRSLASTKEDLGRTT
jgi:hypothetical protein